MACSYLITIGTVAVTTVAVAQPDTLSLKVTVSGYGEKQGEVMVALYSNENNFLEKPVKTEHTKSVSGGATDLIIEGLEPGDYALAAYLDENGNRELDKNFIGIPTEPYGFSIGSPSDGVKAKFAPPDFSDAKIQLSDKQKAISIELK